MNETLGTERKLDALKFFSQTHRGLHEQRRKYETKAFFTALTFFALLGAARFTGKAALPTPLPEWLLIGIWVLVIVTAVVSALYLHGIHGANQVNKKFAQGAEEQIRRMLKDNGAEITDPPRLGKAHAITRVWQIVMIVVFAAAAGFVLTLQSTRENRGHHTEFKTEIDKVSSDLLRTRNLGTPYSIQDRNK